MPRKKTGLASSTKKRYIKSTCHCLILCQNIVGGLYTIISEGKFTQSIAKYALDNWAELREYSSMDTTREQLKTLNSQFTFFMKQKVAAKTNLISLLDNTYPGVNKLFDSPTRDDGSEKWVDYTYSFWHVDCVRKIGLKAFTERY